MPVGSTPKTLLEQVKAQLAEKQDGPNASDDNARALQSVTDALHWLACEEKAKAE